LQSFELLDISKP